MGQLSRAAAGLCGAAGLLGAVAVGVLAGQAATPSPTSALAAPPPCYLTTTGQINQPGSSQQQRQDSINPQGGQQCSYAPYG